MATIGFVGLGTMGGAMAMHLWNKRGPSDSLLVWNRSEARRQPFLDAGVPVASSLANLAQECDAIVLCVNKTEDVDGCLAEIVPSANSGLLIIDHSTILPAAAKRMAEELKAKDIDFVDAPITGGSMGAANGTLTLFCGGAEEPVARALQIVQPYSRRAERVGDSGAGQMMKMVNQIAVAGALLALCEALAFAHASGLDLHQTRELVGSGAAGSWAFENYGPKILNRDWSLGFSIDNQVKDLEYCLQTAELMGMYVPGTQLVNNLLNIMREQGRGQDTTAALFDLLVSWPREKLGILA